jgi:hypothetical protein
MRPINMSYNIALAIAPCGKNGKRSETPNVAL